MDKITGLYSYDNEKNVRRFVYTYEDSNGNIKYGVTDDEEKAKSLMVDLLKAKGCKTKEDAKEKLNEDIFKLNCKDENDVFKQIKKANKYVKLNIDDYYDSMDEYDDKEKGSKLSGILNRAKNLGSTVKNIPKKAWYRFKDLPRAKKVKYSSAFVAIAVAVGIGAFFINKSKSPTNNGPKVAITDGIGDLDKDIDKAIEPKEEEKTPDATEEPQVTAEQSSTDYYTYNTDWTQSGNSGSNVTTEPGTVDESKPGFQDPDANIDNPTPPTEPETPDDSYENVIEDEEDNNYPEGEEPDDDYSEEIDVPAGGEDGSLDEGDIILDDEHKGDEGAIDILPGDGDYEIDYVDPGAPLPDPGDTANGDYVTSDEELQDTNKGEQPSEIPGDEKREEVPVYQDENITTTNTTATTTTDLETAASQAVEAMANGEVGNIVVNADGSISFEQDTNTIEANGMTK